MLKTAVLFFVFAFPPALHAAEIEFAESVPEETVYGSALAARPAPLWTGMIDGASRTLDIEEFYIADKTGEALGPVMEAVRRAASRGVKVRIMAEKAMMKETGRSFEGLAGLANIETRVIDFKKAAGGIQHAKFFIVDGREVYVGSQNFDWRSLSQIHETGARIRSERAAADFGAVFAADWALAGGADSGTIFAAAPARPLNASGPETASVRGGTVSYSLAFSPRGFIPGGFDDEIGMMVRLIGEAKKTIRAQVMTYSLSGHGRGSRWKELDNALRAAGGRGVKVELMFADWAMGGKADKDIKSLSRAKNVSVRISSLPQPSRGFVPFARVDHSKYMVFDGKAAILSTSNWGYSYFYQTRGAALVVRGEPGAAVLEDIFSRSWNGPYAAPVDPEKDYKAAKRM